MTAAVCLEVSDFQRALGTPERFGCICVVAIDRLLPQVEWNPDAIAGLQITVTREHDKYDTFRVLVEAVDP